MVDIGTSDKITNLWPTPPARSIDKSGQKDNSKNKQRNSKQKQKKEGPGSQVDEYA